MYLAVKRELQGIVSSVGTAGHSALLDVFSAKLEEIYSLHEVQTQTTPPKTATRNDALDETISLALVVAGPLGGRAGDGDGHRRRGAAADPAGRLIPQTKRHLRNGGGVFLQCRDCHRSSAAVEPQMDTDKHK